jgi:hypothetical protein
MAALRYLLRILGYLWSLPHTLIGVLALLTVYFPKSIRWKNGALEVVVRWHLIPRGLDRTGDGDVDDPEDFRTGGQTHGIIIFLRDEEAREGVRLGNHERVHVVQCMIFGGVLYPLMYGLSCGFNLCRGQSMSDAYHNCIFEKRARAWQNDGVPWLLR